MVLLERPQLVARLRAAIDASPLVVVQAPLGFAKTSAVAAAVAGATVAWYEAAPWDAADFYEPLVAAVRGVRPDFGRHALALTEQHAGPQRIGAAFASELRHVEAPLAIVIDDAHHLDGAAFGPFVDALMRRVPAYVHVVVLSRQAPAFGMADLVAHERAVVFGAHELRFARNEMTALAALLRKRVASDVMEALETRTEGWPAGVALALRTGVQTLPRSGGGIEATSAYLVEQLLQALAPPEIALLESLAVYQQVDRIVIEGLQLGGALGALNDLERQGAMISRLPDNGYRIHPMLGSVLRQRIRERDGEAALAAMHVRAGALFAKAGRAAPAVFHYERGGDPSALRAFLRMHTVAAVISVGFDRLSTLVARVESDGIRDDALSAYFAGWRAKQRGGEDARDRFSEAVSHADTTGDAMLAFAARAQIIEGDIGRGITVERATIEDMRERARALGPAERMGAAIRAAWHAVIEGRFDDALRLADESPDDGTPLHRYYIAPLRAYALTALGRSDRAEAELNALVDALDQSDSLVLRVSGLVWAARFALLRTDVAAAWDYAREAERASNPFDRRAEAAGLYIALAEAAAHAGDADATLAAADNAREFADLAWYGRDRMRIRALAGQFTARAAAIRGDFAGALRIAMTNMNESRPLAQIVTDATDAAWYATLCGEKRVANDARTHAREQMALTRPLDLADAAALHVASELLALLDARDGKAARTSTFDPGIFSRYVAARPELASGGVRFESMLAALVPDARSLSPAAAEVTENLTPRETEILSLLVLGLTNKEIAQRLVVSPRTVETHVERVLGKLGVNTRSRAIAKAVRSGLVAVTQDV